MSKNHVLIFEDGTVMPNGLTPENKSTFVRLCLEVALALMNNQEGADGAEDADKAS